MDLTLGSRDGLPDALRVLLRDYPREAWGEDPRFHGLVSFWLQMHLQFREELAWMRQQARAVLAGEIDPHDWAPGLARRGGQLVQHLHGHHSIEDHHYFPVLAARDPRITRGFEILDGDHKELDGLIAGFVDRANGALSSLEGAAFHDRAAQFHDGLLRFERFLERHLTDEEDLVVPVLLRDGETGLY